MIVLILHHIDIIADFVENDSAAAMYAQFQAITNSLQGMIDVDNLA